MDQDHPDEHHNNGETDNRARVFTETFVFTGTSGQSILATMQNLMNRFVGGAQLQLQPQAEQQSEQQEQQQASPNTQRTDNDVEHGDDMSVVSDPSGEDIHTEPLPSTVTIAQDLTSTAQVPIPTVESGNVAAPQSFAPPTTMDEDDEMPELETLPGSSDDQEAGQPPSMQRPVRPLPRNAPRSVQAGPQPHAHFHAHTPNGTIDLFTFTVGPGEAMPPPPPTHGAGGGPTFTFNLGPMPGEDALAALFLGMPPFFEKDREPDIERAKVLLRGMEVVPEGLVRRLEHAGGVPGGHGTEEDGSAAGCSVCWGPLLEEVEPGEWETALPGREKKGKKEEKEKTPDMDESEEKDEEDELHGRIVALPCAHVYHAECLLPWFSRQTTCPTCRLDIDPESLTWTPRPPLAPPPADLRDNAQPTPPNVPQPSGNTPLNQPSELEGAQTNPDATGNTDRNTAEAARFFRFMNSPFLFWQSRPPGAVADGGPAPTNNPSGPQVFAPPQPSLLPPPPPHSPAPSAATPQPQPYIHLHPQVAIPRFMNHPSIVPQSQPQSSAGNTPPQPPVNPQPTPNNPHGFQPTFVPFPMFFVQSGGAPPHAHTETQGAGTGQAVPPQPPRPKSRKWSPPEPVGKTLRQRVEQKERELGLRCDDAVCGLAPTDEDPVPCGDAHQERVQIHAAYDVHGKACEHSFHPACLLMSARVAGVTGEEEEDTAVQEVQVACPTCRAVGSLPYSEWADAVSASEREVC